MTQVYFGKVKEMLGSYQIAGKPFPDEIVDRIAGLSMTSVTELHHGAVEILGNIAVVAGKENPDAYFKVLQFLDQIAWVQRVVGVSSMYEQPEDIWNAKQEADRRDSSMWDSMIAQAVAMADVETKT